MNLYKSSRTTISALDKAGAIKVWEQESGEVYPGDVNDWCELTGRVTFTFLKSEPIAIPGTAFVTDAGDGYFFGHADAKVWAEFWPNKTVGWENG